MGVVAVSNEDISNRWAVDATTVLEELGVNADVGLSEQEVATRRREFGLNRLRSIRTKAWLSVLLAQFRSIVIWLLLAAACVALLFGDLLESLAIVAVIVINASIGFVTELRAVRSIEALRKLGRVETTVRRDGVVQKVPAEMLVPGDIVLIESGDIVTADMRLTEAAKLEADESTLTGESEPVVKSLEVLPLTTHLAERANLLFKGTLVTRGSGCAVVTGTGLNTELGRISELVSEAEAEHTPLEKRLDALARRLVWITLVVAALVGVIGVLGGREMVLAIEVAIALAVAAIPEGLPIVATIALARGMWRMARSNALVARLSAVETLGATSVILTDKTGTLTENRMTVTELMVSDATLALSGTGLETDGELTVEGQTPGDAETKLARELLTIAALCNNASLDRDDSSATVVAVGDPTEVALLVAAAKLGIERAELLGALPEVAEEPFDPATRSMATFHRDREGFLEAVKGAPESILEACSTLRTGSGDVPLTAATREEWLDRSHALGSRGLRTLAIATRSVTDPGTERYRDLILLGLLGVHDPARPGVREALAACRDSGITVVMVTGDHAATARSIAEDLGLLRAEDPVDAVLDGRNLARVEQLDDQARQRFVDARVIARASPEQKLELITLHQARNHVVAMTGDGVNDAPALKKADIGVAMGQRGTEVAKESAAMILQDDRFETIVEAVAQGRAIYENIRKFVIYLMSCNLSEILIVGLATLAGAPLPLLPLQILFLNLVTDVFPALALGVGEGAPGLMQRPPRPADEPLLTRAHWRTIFIYGLTMSATVLGAMALAVFYLGIDVRGAVTISFLTLAFAQLWHVFNMRHDWRRPFSNEITRNPWIWAAVILCVALTVGAVYLPLISDVLSLVNPGIRGWVLVLIMSAVPLVMAPLVNLGLNARHCGKPQSVAGGSN
jgi:Ca2+-transporting ATPase